MELHLDRNRLEHDPATKALVEYLRASASRLKLDNALLYHEFPIFRDTEGILVTSRLFLVSPSHGVVVFGTSNATRVEENDLGRIERELDEVFNSIFSRLLRNKALRKGKREIVCPADAAIFAPFLAGQPIRGDVTESDLIRSDDELDLYLKEITAPPLDLATFTELVATVEGAKGLVRPLKRESDETNPNSKGAQVARLEAEITSFDRKQKTAYMSEVTGAQRIRGLAGSGKTVILAMKAALTHLRYPDATILYTFYTKSLYQHVKRLITRFYRQFNDVDPDWDKVRVLHAWGGSNYPGVYADACKAFGQRTLTFSEASRQRPGDEFGFICADLLASKTIHPLYDYSFIDEGQDFPASFLQLCRALTRDDKFVWAYDEFQTIFKTQAPSMEDIFGRTPDGRPSVELTEDVVLYKCYRNPREILVGAHAVGLGLYGKIVQMLPDKEHWKDIGYIVRKGELTEGETVEIERPEENSLTSISRSNPIDEIIKVQVASNFTEEVNWVAASIADDIAQGLRPEEVLVICTDNRNTNAYLKAIGDNLIERGIGAHNFHADRYGLADFTKEGYVTLSTAYKAKGNEAYMVYITGIDATFAAPDVRSRNTVFAALTRAKAWVRISGVGNFAAKFASEIVASKQNFPFLRFTYPSKEQLTLMKRDLETGGTRRREIDRALDLLESQLSEEEIEELVKARILSRDKARIHPK